MKCIVLLSHILLWKVFVTAAPLPGTPHDVSLRGILRQLILSIDRGTIIGRDGSSEFDTDLCILKKRGDVLGMGIDNCDM
jgi:hypothetical protein